MHVIDKLAPQKITGAKSHTQEWFDGEVLELINSRDKLFQKYKKSKLQVDKDNYKAAKNLNHSTILRKKKEYIKNALTENIGKPKKLWRVIKSLGLETNKSSSNICLQKDGELSFEATKNVKTFKNFYAYLA